MKKTFVSLPVENFPGNFLCDAKCVGPITGEVRHIASGGNGGAKLLTQFLCAWGRSADAGMRQPTLNG